MVHTLIALGLLSELGQVDGVLVATHGDVEMCSLQSRNVSVGEVEKEECSVMSGSDAQRVVGAGVRRKV